MVGQLALYPASVSLPLMANYGAMGEPKGMLHVQLHKVEGLKSSDIASKADPYVVFEVRVNGACQQHMYRMLCGA